MAAWAAALITLAGVAAYSNSFAGVFVFDDEPAIEHNPNLAALVPLSVALQAPPDTTLSGRPVATLTFAIDHVRSAGSIAAYHATNLLIHLAATLLLFGVIRRTLLTAPLADRFGAAAFPLALVIALVFVVHPLQTGSVTYLVQRVESLMGFFYLATLYGSIRALDAPSLASRRAWAIVAIVSCALGMGVKEVMVTAPLMVMLWDRQFAPPGRASRKYFYAALCGAWVLLGVLVSAGPRAASVGLNFEGWPWWRYLMTQAEVVAHYLRLALYPDSLVLDYDWPAAASIAQVAAPGALILALLGATAWGLVRRMPIAFAGAWFFLILAPTSSVLPIVTEVAAEHRMYLPLAAIIALIVLGAFDLGCRVAGTLEPSRRRALAWTALLISGLVVTALAHLTWTRNLDYQDYDRIWSDTIAKRPANARARNNYATSLLSQGRFADAEPHLRVAVEQKPSFVEAQANLGVALSAQGRLDEGVGHLQQAIRLRPDFAEAHRNLGENYAVQHRMAEAASEYTRALDTLPDDVRLLNRAAWILATANDPRARDGARARSFAERAVRLTSRQDPESLDSLAAALAENGDFDAAAATAQEALRRARLRGDPALVGELERRAALFARGERFREP